ncbi:MAG TPA: DMT family transporter, partial [Clostridia bacterium]|nr:DMT family transporter [Clostridia bacterium]
MLRFPFAGIALSDTNRYAEGEGERAPLISSIRWYIETEKRTVQRNPAVLYALDAAALYALNIPVSKLLLVGVSPAMLAAFLYLGAGAGVGLLRLIGKRMRKETADQPLTRHELPYTLAMIVLDILAPILLMLGLKTTAADTASLLGSFEIVATAILAMILFSEKVSGRLWIAIALITLASLVLSLEGTARFSFSPGAVLVLAAC